ncbi:uncharacterized protein B0H64DRAFT_68020 [Chaetomium fimeti]|uniref:Uncharacterized protein n=1 Tax=Chaetomium fimeti TaxID=1854472 RepID=A0AAE0HKE7_9PEZI|nr:hypothetical protein B0H64DRAFT_68020 [Chaetomium fimeti]
MKFALTALLGLASLVLAEDVVCPTATRTIQNRACGNECPFTDCTFHTTIQNPCGCPSTLPTATLIAPCQAPCPYQGCDIDFRTSAEACPTTTPKTTTTTKRTTPTSTPTGVITSIVTLPPRPTTTTMITSSSIPCPKVTRTTSPAGCDPIRCPVPTCRVESEMLVPCGCEPKTVLFVTGCQTACATGCLTRTRTSSLAC